VYEHVRLFIERHNAGPPTDRRTWDRCAQLDEQPDMYRKRYLPLTVGWLHETLKLAGSERVDAGDALAPVFARRARQVRFGCVA
jgi:hypothetical protein